MKAPAEIYDCFLFYKELDLLEVRLNTLNDVVDHFVLIESTRTFTGDSKPLFYEENKERFSSFSDKIIHVVVEDDPPQCNSAWDRETFQRNAAIRGLQDCKQPHDVIMLSDLDEIPHPKIIKNLSRITKPIRCQQLYCYYYYNNLNITKPWWSGTRIVYRKHMDKWTSQQIRKLPRRHCKLVGYGGWHFSFLGDIRFISDKINHFSHQEFNNEQYNTPGKIRQAMENGLDMFGRDFKFKAFDPDDLLPAYVLETRTQYTDFLRDPTLSSNELSRILGPRGKPNWLQQMTYKWNKHRRKKA